MVEPEHALAVLADVLERVGDEEEGLAAGRDVGHAVVTLALKLLVAHGQGLVHQQDVGIHVGRDREGQPRGHAGREGANGGVDEVLQLGPLHDAIQAHARLLARESQQCALDHDVLTPRQLSAESEAQFQDRGDSPSHDDAALRGHEHPADHPKQRALAGAVSANDSDSLAGSDRQVHALQRHEVAVGHRSLQAADRVLLERLDALVRDAVAHRDTLESDRLGPHANRPQLQYAIRSARCEK